MENIDLIEFNPIWLPNVDFDGTEYFITSVTLTNGLEIVLGLESGKYFLDKRDIFTLRDLQKQIANDWPKTVKISEINFLVYETPLRHATDKRLLLAVNGLAGQRLPSLSNADLNIISGVLRDSFPQSF